MNSTKETAVLKLRQLKRGDRDAVLAIEAEGFQTSTLQFNFADYFDDDGNFGLVVVEKKNLVAYMLCEDQSDHIYLAELAVAKCARRKGIGRLLVTWLIDHLADYDCNRIELDVATDNAPAIACYQSLGFKRALQLSGRHSLTMEWKRPGTARRKRKIAN